VPVNPDIHLEAETADPDELAGKVVDWLMAGGFLGRW
jgi:hypothetical protein